MAKQQPKNGPKNTATDLQTPADHDIAISAGNKKQDTPASFREVINELNLINRQMHSTHKTLLTQFRKANRPNMGLWPLLKEKLSNIQWDEEDLAEKIQEAESIEINEKERQKIVKRRKPLREKIRKSQPLLLIHEEDNEDIATSALHHINKSDPILNIAERILLNLSTDNHSNDTISIQKAKEDGLISLETTPFSYPDMSEGNEKTPYYISNHAILTLYQLLEDTCLRAALPASGNFIETEEMIIASQLEKYVKVHYNKNSKHVELVAENIDNARAPFNEIAKKRYHKKHNQNAESAIARWLNKFKR